MIQTNSCTRKQLLILRIGSVARFSKASPSKELKTRRIVEGRGSETIHRSRGLAEKGILLCDRLHVSYEAAPLAPEAPGPEGPSAGQGTVYIHDRAE